MHWLKHALLSLSVTFCSAWTSTFTDVETDNSVVAASAKAHENRQLSASDLLARAEEINDAYQASVLAGFQPGQAQTLWRWLHCTAPSARAIVVSGALSAFRFVPESPRHPLVNVAWSVIHFAQQNVLDLIRSAVTRRALSMTACQTI